MAEYSSAQVFKLKLWRGSPNRVVNPASITHNCSATKFVLDGVAEFGENPAKIQSRLRSDAQASTHRRPTDQELRIARLCVRCKCRELLPPGACSSSRSSCKLPSSTTSALPDLLLVCLDEQFSQATSRLSHPARAAHTSS